MIIFAHRGASASAPANTLPAFALAREMGCSCYELDVHLTRDGRLAVYHDYNLAAGTTCTADIHALFAQELTSCTIKSAVWPEKLSPPLLEDVLPVVAPGLDCLNIEIKNDGGRYPGIERILLENLNAWDFVPLHKILFSSFDYSTLLRLRALFPQARIGWLTRAFDACAARELGACSVHVNHTRLTREIAEACHSQNQKVFVYTVNERELAAQVLAQGADGIFTDKPELFL